LLGNLHKEREIIIIILKHVSIAFKGLAECKAKELEPHSQSICQTQNLARKQVKYRDFQKQEINTRIIAIFGDFSNIVSKNDNFILLIVLIIQRNE